MISYRPCYPHQLWMFHVWKCHMQTARNYRMDLLFCRFSQELTRSILHKELWRKADVPRRLAEPASRLISLKWDISIKSPFDFFRSVRKHVHQNWKQKYNWMSHSECESSSGLPSETGFSSFIKLKANFTHCQHQHLSFIQLWRTQVRFRTSYGARICMHCANKEARNNNDDDDSRVCIKKSNSSSEEERKKIVRVSTTTTMMMRVYQRTAKREHRPTQRMKRRLRLHWWDRGEEKNAK